MARVQGLERLKAKLTRLQKQTAAEMSGPLMQAAEVIVAEQKRLAPVKSGKLRDSIQATFGGAVRYAAFQGGSNADRSRQQVRISAGNDQVRYAHLVEFGTAPHSIQPENREVLKIGADDFAESAEHPGATAQPFFFPGYRATRKKARSIIGKAVRESVKKAVK